MALDPSRGANVPNARYTITVDFPQQQGQPPGRSSAQVGEGLFDRASKAIGKALGQVLPYMPYHDPRKAGVDAAQEAILRAASNRLGTEPRLQGADVGFGTRDGTPGLEESAGRIRRQEAYGALGALDANKVDGDAMRLLQDVTQRFGDQLDASKVEDLVNRSLVTLDDARQALADAFESQSGKSGVFSDYLTVSGNRAAGLDEGRARQENFQTLGAIRANRNVSNATMGLLQEAVKGGGLDSRTLAKYLNEAGTTITRREAADAIERSRQQYQRDQGAVYA
jgi:hypothetical protein